MDDLDLFIQSGKITSQAREYGKTLVKKGAVMFDVAQAIEQKIRELGAVPAFPVGLSFNEIAAHWTPAPNEERIFADDLIKLDLGACFEGAVTDTAVTIDLSGKHEKIVKASEDALNAAIATLRPGVMLCEIGDAIEHAMYKYGMQPVRNLSGHGIGINIVHKAPTIPNYNNGNKTTLKKGDLIAIEPFATSGEGIVGDYGPAEFFMLLAPKQLRDPGMRVVVERIKQFQGRPFTRRWLDFPQAKVLFTLRELEKLGVLHKYPPLVEKTKAPVAQTEHAFYIDDEVIVLTK